ncbi:AAA family ATPase [Nocardia xishanensis]|uniref:AAA family ATPase n=1 Tax=Nocardia xishanensis TaxID=238964 RepID=A0ABW7X8Z3_9NOCA
MSRNNDLPMLPPWLSDSEVTGGYEAPVENLPHDELIDDAPDRKKRRKSQAPDGRSDANQASGRKDKKRRWLGRDKDEPVEEPRTAPPAAEQRRQEPPADPWGQPRSGWSSGPDASAGRPGDSRQQQSDGPIQQQPIGGPEHAAPPRFDAHGQAPQPTGGPGSTPPQQSGGPGSTPPQQSGGPGQPIGGPGQSRPDQIGGPSQQQSGGPGQPIGGPGQARPDQIGGPSQQQSGGPGQPIGGPGQARPDQIGGPSQQQTGAPGHPPQPPVGDGGPQWSAAPEQFGGPGRMPQQHGIPGQPPHRQTGAPGYQPMSGPGPQPQQPIGPGQPPPIDGSSQAGQRPGEAWGGQPHPDDPGASAPQRQGGHSGLPTRQPSQPSDAFQPLGQRTPAPTPESPAPTPAPEPPASNEATTRYQRQLPDLPPPPPSDVRPSPAAEESSARATGDHAADPQTGHGVTDRPTENNAADPRAEHSVTDRSVANHVADSPAGQRIPAGDSVSPPPAVDHVSARTNTGSPSRGQDRTPTASTEGNASAAADHAATEFDAAPPWLAGPGADASPGPAAAAPPEQGLPPRTPEGSTPSSDAPPSWLGGPEQRLPNARPELPPPPANSIEQSGSQAPSPTAPQTPPSASDIARPGAFSPAAHAGGTSAAADPANVTERPNSVSRPIGDEAAPASSARPDERSEGGLPPRPDDSAYGPAAVGRGQGGEFTRNPAGTTGTAEDAESARGGRHRLPGEPEPSERQWGAPGPAQGGHRAPVSDQPAPGQVRRDPGVFAQQGGQAPGGEMPWAQAGYGAQPPLQENTPQPGYGYAGQRQGGYAPAPGPDAYHIPGDRRPGEPGYPTQSGPEPVQPANNNAPGFVAPAPADQQPPAWNQGAQPPAAPQGPTGESWGRPQHGPTGESWGQQPQHGGQRQPQPGQPSLDDVPLRRAKKAPGSGWRKAVHHMSGGAINPGLSAEELRLQELVARIRQPVRGDYRIAVLSLKGGVGKTTTTMGLGSIFASIRGDRVIAVDANPDFGTLSQRVPLQTRSTVRDLLLDPSIERYSDVRRHTSQATSRLEVLASERDPAASEAFNDEEYRAVARILQRYYNIILTDCGTGLMHSAMAGVLDLAHSLVLISSAAIDGARSAAATLDWLSLHGHDHLVRNAVVVINLPREGSPNVGVQQLREYFLSRCRAVHIIPYDSHLSEGAEIDLHRLSKQAKRAYVELAATVADEFAVDHRRFHA